MKNSNETIGKRTRDLPACSAVPQPTAPPAACPLCIDHKHILTFSARGIKKLNCFSGFHEFQLEAFILNLSKNLELCENWRSTGHRTLLVGLIIYIYIFYFIHFFLPIRNSLNGVSL
jgi:hypothetical protein